jgi:hypothetical protein
MYCYKGGGLSVMALAQSLSCMLLSQALLPLLAPGALIMT